MMHDLCELRIPAADSARSNSGSESPPNNSPPTLMNPRRDIPSQNGPDA